MKLPATALALLLALFAGHHAWFVWRSSFVVDGERYFALFDDAMVSMSYARTLAGGGGLVWFPGAERVEGITNPLWTLAMALPHLAGLPDRLASLPVQVFGGALLLVAGWGAARLAAESAPGIEPAAVLLAAAVCVGTFPVAFWALSGMEVSAVMAIAAWAGVWHLRAARAGAVSRGAWALLGVGVLVRMDAAVIAAGFAAGLWMASPAARRGNAAWAAACVGGALAALAAARWAYYGEVLPNTYHLKADGFPAWMRWMRGASVLATTITATGLVMWIVAAAAGGRAMGRRGAWVLGAPIAAIAAYHVHVGGDAWEGWRLVNRFVGGVWPLAAAFAGIGMGALACWMMPGEGRRGARAGAMAAMAGPLLLVLSFGNASPEHSVPRYLVWPDIEPAFAGDNARNTVIAREIVEKTHPGASVLVSYAGVTAYFAPGRVFIDALGKNDARIARSEPVVPPGRMAWRYFVPGHTKFDYEYSIGERRPDVVVPPNVGWVEAGRALGDDYVESGWLLLRRGSEMVRWERAETKSEEDP